MWFNGIMIWLLKSPFHGMISKNVMLVTVTGRRSGRAITLPTSYLRVGDTLWVISWRVRTWWKNLRGGAKVQVLLEGHSREGLGQVLEEQQAVAQSLCDYYRKSPQVARYVKIRVDAAGQPLQADCERAALKNVVVKIDLA